MSDSKTIKTNSKKKPNEKAIPKRPTANQIKKTKKTEKKVDIKKNSIDVIKKPRKTKSDFEKLHKVEISILKKLDKKVRKSKMYKKTPAFASAYRLHVF